MLSSLLRPPKGRRRTDKSPFSSPSPVAVRNRGLNEHGDTEEEDRDHDGDEDAYDEGDADYHEDEEDEDEDEERMPLLPIFSAAHLDKLPLYNITHSIRILIVQKCETTLSWDQLRSPQVSQFVVKPVQSEIRMNHFNRATLCALIANCLQFKKESEMNPGNSGVSRTRAMVSELLAMRLIREFNTRELIDALSYDFDPLQGLSPPGTGTATPGQDLHKARQQGRGARISTVEIAIRAQAKRFLAHPLVVQQLEAIWAGTIVFHSAADNLHRKPLKQRIHDRRYGTLEEPSPTTVPADDVVSKKDRRQKQEEPPLIRRSVTLYDPRDASLFKLSRLRVPRYRQLFSTISFAIMLGLFLAVLIDKSVTITPLEIVFWFWSAGYMLDEVVGFTEQGFGLYIMSVWNAFDLGILLLFVVYYVLRLYGILVPNARKHRTANMAYDVLASTGVLLFPRAFNVLDHYRYFSQLLIAFRLMAQDLVAVLILIMISCSGFFVAFTFSFQDDKKNYNDVAYQFFQILMGFTPAAWEMWAGYNVLAKALMGAFLIICHFLIVTILITVLTNSFMDIVRNANEEHQFLFAVNTISMVKSDALFSYIAPTNLAGWVLSPLRYIVPFRQYVKLNRTIIKTTHFPVLFLIFAYERLILSTIAYEPTDLVERRTRVSMKFRLPGVRAPDQLTPQHRLREPSVVSFRKDKALEEVFRRPYHDSTLRGQGRDVSTGRRESPNVVDTWMQGQVREGGASPPLEQPRSVVDRLESRRPAFRRAATSDRRVSKRDCSTATRSVLSDPADMRFSSLRGKPIEEETDLDMTTEHPPQETDADGDDELVTQDEADEADDVRTETHDVRDTTDIERERPILDAPIDEEGEDEDDEDDHRPITAPPLSSRPNLESRASAGKSRQHGRHVSSGTILFSPMHEIQQSHSKPGSSSASELLPRRTSRPATARHTNSGGTATPALHPLTNLPDRPPRSAEKRPQAPRPRPGMPARDAYQTAPNLKLQQFHFPSSRARNPSFNARALDLASDLGDNRYGPDIDAGGIGGIPASFSDQLLREREWTLELERRREEERRRSEEEEKGMVGRIMLARMNTMEEGFRELLKEVRDLRKDSRGGSEVGAGSGGTHSRSRSGMALSQMAGNLPKKEVGKGKKSPRKIQRRSREIEDGAADEVQRPDSAETEVQGERERMAIKPVAASEERENGGEARRPAESKE